MEDERGNARAEKQKSQIADAVGGEVHLNRLVDCRYLPEHVEELSARKNEY